MTAGPFTFELRSEHEPGAAIASIRYEAIGAGGRGTGGVDALVRDVVFLGDGRELILDAGGATVVSRVAGSASLAFARGDRVAISIDPTNVAIIRE